MVLLLVAFSALSFGYLTADQISYQLLQIVGAGGLALDSFASRALPAALMNAAWIAISVTALTRILVA